MDKSNPPNYTVIKLKIPQMPELMKKIHLRQYRNSDKDDVVRLHVAALQQMGAFVNDPSLDTDLNNIKEVYMDNEGTFLVASYRDTIVGIGALKKVNKTTAEIKRMRIDIRFQRQGIGSMILRRLIKKAKMLGYKKIVLDTVAAKKFYQKYGFKEYKKGTFRNLPTSHCKLVFR